MMPYRYTVDASASKNKKDLRIISSSDMMLDLAEFFLKWVRDNELVQSDLREANLYELRGGSYHLVSAYALDPDGRLIICPPAYPFALNKNEAYEMEYWFKSHKD